MVKMSEALELGWLIVPGFELLATIGAMFCFPRLRTLIELLDYLETTVLCLLMFMTLAVRT